MNAIQMPVADRLTHPDNVLAFTGLQITLRMPHPDMDDSVDVALVSQGRRLAYWQDVATCQHPGDVALIQALLDYMSIGGRTDRIIELAESLRVADSQISFDNFELLAVFDDRARTLFYRHDDGRVFEVDVGSFVQEVKPDDFEEIADYYGIDLQAYDAATQAPTGV